MEDYRVKFCRDVARKAISKYKITSPPVDVVQIADGEGYKVIKMKLNCSGRLVGNEIHINSEHAKTRQRFTIAHELGHHFLGHTLQGQESDFENRQANIFAAELLMPLPLLEKSVTSADSMRKLAKEYNVSSEAVYYHLKDLRFLNKVIG